MKTRTLVTLIVLLGSAGSLTHAAPMGTAFTYQGELNSGGNVASGFYDFSFALFDAATGGAQKGLTLNTNAVRVADGRFLVMLDFGEACAGEARWLEISVKTNGAVNYALLAPRQALTPTPYAVMANSSSNLVGFLPAGSVGAFQLMTAAVGNAALAAGAVTSDKIADGAIVNADINASGIDGGKIVGGDLTAFRLKVGTNHTLSGTWATIAGGTGSTATGNRATIGGGDINQATNNHTTVGGGNQNKAYGDASTVGGGNVNTASGLASTVSGGDGNAAGGDYATIGGGGDNVASGVSANVGGGFQNSAAAQDSTVGGGYWNTASGQRATVPGGFHNRATGDYSFAAGQSAVASATGSTVFSDVSGGDFVSTVANEFAIRAFNGVRVESDVGIHLNAVNRPLIVRDWDRFTGSAPNGKANLGRWGLFMEPYALVLGIPNTDVGARSMEVARYNTDGTRDKVFGVGNDGVTTVKVLSIVGGADLAEPFAISDKEQAPKGSVMVIDDQNPGQLRVSGEPYDKRVAGVISGAGGLNPGLTIAQQGVNDQGAPVALSGRVYTLADTCNGPIQPGDLLTTSARPGHAMKATDAGRAQGAVLGKAMSSLKEGQGTVLVLVSLQ